MPFLEIVAALRKALGVPEALTLPEAVRHMSELMGLPTIDPDGKPIPLPAQAEALAESVNLSLPLEAGVLEESGSDLSEEEEASAILSSAQSPASSSRSKKPLKQRESLLFLIKYYWNVCVFVSPDATP